MAGVLTGLAAGLGQILGRTYFVQPNGPLGVPVPLVVLDVVTNEDVEYRADITEHPVEMGPEVSDHAQLKNPIVRLRGKISNTPLDVSVDIANILAGGIAAASSSQVRQNLLNTGLSQISGLAGAALQGKTGNLASSAFAGAMDAISRTILINVLEAKQPFSILTVRQRFDDMLIERLRFPRDENTGYALEFEMDIKHVTIVTPLTVPQFTQVAENVISGTGATSIGSQATQNVSAQGVAGVQSSPTLFSAPGVAAKSPNFGWAP
jgi:hypothetical protein